MDLKGYIRTFCTYLCLYVTERLQFQYLEPAELVKKQFNPRGFAGMSNRVGLKPIIAACNGHAYGAAPNLVLFTLSDSLLTRNRGWFRDHLECVCSPGLNDTRYAS